MNFGVLLLLTVLIVAGVLVVFVRLGVPAYRLDRENVIALLELVLAGKASNSDWEVFIGVPIHNNPELDKVRERCAELAERERLDGDTCRFTKAGLIELAEILASLKDDRPLLKH